MKIKITPIIVFSFSFLLAGSVVSKVSAVTIPAVLGTRTWTYQGPTGQTSPTTDGIAAGAGSGSTPFNIIGKPGRIGSNLLKGIRFNYYGLQGGSISNKYNVVNFTVRFAQFKTGAVPKTLNTDAAMPYIYYEYTTTGNGSQGSGTVPCQVSAESQEELRFNCRIATENYNPAYQGTFVWETSSQLGYIGMVSESGGNSNDIQLYGVSYEYQSSADPLIAGQNTIINQNQQIINQNQEMINSQNETNDWLKDSTPPSVDSSSLGNSVGWLPAGPVDSILTLPLQLLQGIVNVFTNTNCSPLNVPVPYTNTNFTLPCVSTLMDDIGFTPIWALVGGVISAVIIWQTLKWLYKFVDDTLTFRENNSGLWGGL